MNPKDLKNKTMKVKNFLDKNCCLKSSRKCERLLVETVVIPIVYQGYRCWWRLVVLHYGCSFGGSSRWTNDGEDGLRVRVLLVGGSSLQGGLEELSLRKNLFRGGVPVRIRVTCDVLASSWLRRDDGEVMGEFSSASSFFR